MRLVLTFLLIAQAFADRRPDQVGGTVIWSKQDYWRLSGGTYYLREEVVNGVPQFKPQGEFPKRCLNGDQYAIVPDEEQKPFPLLPLREECHPSRWPRMAQELEGLEKVSLATAVWRRVSSETFNCPKRILAPSLVEQGGRLAQMARELPVDLNREPLTKKVVPDARPPVLSDFEKLQIREFYVRGGAGALVAGLQEDMVRSGCAGCRDPAVFIRNLSGDGINSDRYINGDTGAFVIPPEVLQRISGGLVSEGSYDIKPVVIPGVAGAGVRHSVRLGVLTYDNCAVLSGTSDLFCVHPQKFGVDWRFVWGIVKGRVGVNLGTGGSSSAGEKTTDASGFVRASVPLCAFLPGDVCPRGVYNGAK